MNILEELRIAIGHLNKIDNYTASLNQELSTIDEKISDLLHLIENNKINTAGCYRIVKEIRELRIQRRNVKNNIEIARIYNEQKNKLLTNENRIFLIQELCKKEKSLDSTYKNRQYTEDDLKKFI